MRNLCLCISVFLYGQVIAHVLFITNDWQVVLQQYWTSKDQLVLNENAVLCWINVGLRSSLNPNLKLTRHNETPFSVHSTRGLADKVSAGYYTPFKIQTLTHSRLSGNRQSVSTGLKEWSLLRDSTSLQGTSLADLICEHCALIARGYALLLFPFTL